MKKRLVMTAILSLVCMLASVAPAAAAPVAALPTRLLAHPEQVVLADNNGVVVMSVGERFTVALGEGPTWTVETGDQAILSRVPNIMMVRGAQGIYTAHAAGVTTLTATGTYPCQFTTPRCMIAIPDYRLTVVVEPARSAQGSFAIGSAGFTRNGQADEAQAPAYIDHDRTFVAAAALSQALGAGNDGLKYDAVAGKGSLTLGDSVLTFQTGNYELMLGTTAIQMDVAPEVRDGVLYLPLRWISEVLGYRVSWDGTARTATLGAP